jgi:predicted Ser/Thr protein kinase/intein/homing endonuclease
MSSGKAILELLRRELNLSDYRKIHWEGTFEEYLDIVRRHPEVTRTAYQRLYDMILAHGTEEVFEHKEKVTRFRFFTEFAARIGDAIYGLDRPLMNLANTFKSAAKGYGTERRVLLLHGPVGSSKSTIARLLKKGLEEYSRTDEGMVFSFAWRLADGSYIKCPMHEEPLHLVPQELRPALLAELNADRKPGECEVTLTGELDPFCRQMFRERMAKHNGDWAKVVEEVKVYRLTLSEQDRIGIGTFQPKDEKNQDSTELTGDINYRKIAEYGTDSDPRCVAAETLIATGEGLREMGKLLPVQMPPDTFVPRPLPVSTIGPARTALADSVYSGAAVPLCTLTTRLGYRLTGSRNHMVLTLTPEGEPAWKELRLVELGDYVALGRGIHTWAADGAKLPAWQPERYGNERQHPRFPEAVTPSLGRFLGLWLGDGHFYIKPQSHQYELGWTQQEPERRQQFAQLLRDLFAVEPRIVQREDHAGGVLVGTRALVQWLKEVIGLRGGARNKAIPDCILQSSRECILACLDGLWLTDGTVRENGSNWAMFATCSETLARQVHVLLLALGVVSSLKRCPSDWEVRVYGQNVNRLVELLPALRGRFTVGAERVARALPNVDVLPFVKPRMRAIYQRARNREALKRRYSGNLHDSRKPNVSYPLLAAFLSEVETDDAEALRWVRQLRHLLDQDYVWLPVASIEPAALARVYDVSVADTHAYWANGFISHNCFNFDGELNIANRGLVEFIEVLKLDVAFLYDLLGASQEHKIKPKKFAQTDIDEVILGHTNEPEYRRLQNNEFMEALRDRTVKIDIPYVTRLKEEIKIYEKDFNPDRVKGKHIAPHTIEIAAMWAVLTRLEQPKHANLTLLQKLKLYNGKTLPGFTEDNIIELKREAVNEGMHGISPRYIQDKISNALVAHPEATSVNPFMVLHELEAGLRHHSLITSQDQLQHYRELLQVVKEEYEDIVKNEVQRAIAADEDALARLCANYIDNVRAYTQREKVRNRYTGNYEEPDERLMRSVEEKIDIPEGRKDDFRREIMNYIGALALDGKRFDYKTNERLQKALELKLFEDQKDTIKLTSLVSNVMDKATQEKIDVVKSRLIRNYGYNEESATDVLTFVASIFARGHTKK